MIPQTGWCKQQTFISHSSGGWEVQDQGASRSGVGEGPLPGLQMDIFSLYPHMVERGIISLLVRALMPFMRSPPSNLITGQRPAV